MKHSFVQSECEECLATSDHIMCLHSFGKFCGVYIMLIVLNSRTGARESQLPAGHIGVRSVPEVITHSAPGSILTDFYTSFIYTSFI